MALPRGAFRLVPLSSLSAEEIPPTTPLFNGLVRNERGFFAVINGDREFMTRIPTREQAHAPSSRQKIEGELYRTAWMNPEMPHLVLLPRFHILNCSLLEPLNVTARTIRLEPFIRYGPIDDMRFSPEKIESWVLAPDVVEKWLRIEGFLRTVLMWLWDEARELFPDDYRGSLHCLPVSFGYATHYDTQGRLLKAVFQSRDVFLPLLAGIALRMLTLDASPRPQWREKLLKQTKIQHQLWDELEHVVTQIVRGPVGGIVDLSGDLAAARDIDWMFSLIIQNNIRVPLYFYLGMTNLVNLSALPSMKSIRFELDDTDVRRLCSLAGEVASSEWVYVKSNSRLWGIFPNRDVTPAPPSAPTPVRELPPVEAGSGQKDGETFRAFFVRRAKQNKHKLDRESHADRQRRLQREKIAVTGGIGKSRVFVWEDTNGDGFYIRRARSRAYAVELWDTYAPSQRHFDGFTNEWDLCADVETDADAAAFTYDDEDDEEEKLPCFINDEGRFTNRHAPRFIDSDNDKDEDEDDFRQRPAFPELPSNLPEEVQSLLEDGSAAVQNVAALYEPQEERVSDAVELPGGPGKMDTVKNTLRFRFGFTESGEEFSDLLEVKGCRNALGDDLDKGTLSQGVQALLQSLLDAKTLGDIPADLVDLRQDKTMIWEQCGVDIKFFERRDGEEYNSTVFVLTPRGEGSNDPWKLVVFSATLVLHIVRLEFRDWRDIVQELTYLGSEFHVVVEGPLQPWSPLKAKCIGLGARREDYKPAQLDYNAYVERRNKFLVSDRGVLALYAGGLIARIARLVIEQPGHALICDDVDIENAEVQVGDPTGGHALYYHRLTREEEDLICGVYSVQMSQLSRAESSGHQVARVSWWPQPAAFFNSGLNTGWWSPNCERWFKGLLKEMEAGQGRLWSQSKWKKNIRFYQSSLRIFNAQNRLGTEYLRDYLS